MDFPACEDKKAESADPIRFHALQTKEFRMTYAFLISKSGILCNLLY